MRVARAQRSRTPGRAARARPARSQTCLRRYSRPSSTTPLRATQSWAARRLRAAAAAGAAPLSAPAPPSPHGWRPAFPRPSGRQAWRAVRGYHGAGMHEVAAASTGPAAAARPGRRGTGCWRMRARRRSAAQRGASSTARPAAAAAKRCAHAHARARWPPAAAPARPRRASLRGEEMAERSETRGRRERWRLARSARRGAAHPVARSVQVVVRGVDAGGAACRLATRDPLPEAHPPAGLCMDLTAATRPGESTSTLRLSAVRRQAPRPGHLPRNQRAEPPSRHAAARSHAWLGGGRRRRRTAWLRARQSAPHRMVLAPARRLLSCELPSLAAPCRLHKGGSGRSAPPHRASHHHTMTATHPHWRLKLGQCSACRARGPARC